MLAHGWNPRLLEAAFGTPRSVDADPPPPTAAIQFDPDAGADMAKLGALLLDE